MLAVVGPAREGKVVESAASTFEPRQDARPGRLKKLELHRPAGFSLDNNCSRPNPTAAYEVAGPDLDDVAAAQLAVDCQVEHGSVANARILV